jgi:hypothetical protein
MKQSKLKHIIAMFMILLFTSIPITFAASTVSITAYAGQHEINGYMSEFDDALTVTAEVTPDNETDAFANFSETNVYAEVFGKLESFDSCEKSGDTYTCSYTSSQADRSAAEKNLIVSVYDDDSTVAASEEVTFYIDGEAPTIGAASYPAYFTDMVNISLELEDEACTSCDNDACSGIDRVEIWMNASLAQNHSVDSAEGDCDYEETIETSVADLGAVDGKQQICVYVYDNVQNEAKKCSYVTVDQTAPSISSSSFVIKDDNGNAVEHIGSASIHTTVSVNITEAGSGLVEESVYGNFSALNDVIGEDYNEMSASCSEYEGNLFVCSWDVYVETAETSVTVKIYAEDEAGNNQVLTKTLGFVEDVTAPVLLSLTSAYSGYLNADNNTLTLEIQEDGSGFDDSNVYLDMAQIQLGNRRADSCAQSGTVWYCYWEQFAIPSSVPHGESIDISAGTIEDDAGNSYDTTTEFEETFVFDEEAPVFINATIMALGREADVITEGDVASITAYLTDDVSGIDAANVYADYSDFDDDNTAEAAQSCTEVDTDLWECYWEYTGALDTETVELNIIAQDNAGNVKDSDDDNVVAEIQVVGISEQVVDYWDDYAEVDEPPMLNPNFLYFSSSGTIVKLDTALTAISGTVPYVHSYQINSCQAGVYYADNQTAAITMYDAAVVGQYYYDETNRAEKYVLLNMPAFFYGKVNATVAEGSTIDVLCSASVTQARSMYSDIYSPNEEVNISVSIPLMGGLYVEPSLASVDKIQTLEKLIKTLDDITKFLGTWTEWGTKICSPVNGIRVVANNLVTILKGINTITVGEASGAVAAGTKVTNALNGFWYGYFTKDDVAKGVDEGRVKQEEIPKTKGQENTFSSGGSLFANKYKMLSMGYLCDTVLCESCTENWNELLLKGHREKVAEQKGEELTDVPGIYMGGEYMSNIFTGDFNFPFNPRENIVIALICNPPCVPGLYSQLLVYKEILIAYNTCLNVAVAKGEDIVQCEQFLTAQICQNIINAFFWHWIWGLKQWVVSNIVNFVFDQVVEHFTNCAPDGKDNESPLIICSAWRSFVALTSIVVTVVDTVNTLQGIFGMEWNMTGNQTSEEQEEELEQAIDADIGDQLGTTPSYG